MKEGKRLPYKFRFSVLKCVHKMSEETPQVIVTFVQREPSDGVLDLSAPFGEQGCLAGSPRGGQRRG